MKVSETVELMLKSSEHNPYIGYLSKEDNYKAAIELAELCKDLAENGYDEDVMNLDVTHWNSVIEKLKIDLT